MSVPAPASVPSQIGQTSGSLGEEESDDEDEGSDEDDESGE